MYPREAREYINLETHIRMLIKAKKKKLETADVHQQKKNGKINCGIFTIFNSQYTAMKINYL